MNFFPLSPRPALAERSSPMGKGVLFSFLMQGASPLASPGLNPGGAGTGGGVSCASGGRGRFYSPDISAAPVPGGSARRFYSPDLPAESQGFSPIPPTRARTRARGGCWFCYATGFAPCNPQAVPPRRRGRGRNPAPSGGLPRRCRITLPSLSPTGGAAVLVAG